MADYRRFYCSHCAQERSFRRPSVKHVAHLFLTVFTLGLWSVCWLARIIGAGLTPWRCRYCRRTREGVLAPSEPSRPSIYESPLTPHPRARVSRLVGA